MTNEVEYLGIKLEDWFKYHPPTTEDRKSKHKKVNNLSFNLAKNINSTLDVWGLLVDEFMPHIFAFTDQDTPVNRELSTWFMWLGERLRQEDNPTNRLFTIQQIRMFANQAITFDSL